KHWGETGGTLGDKDKEIRVRMGKFTKQPWCARGATTGVFSKRCVGNKGLRLAPQVGFEPTTLRLTAEWLIATSRCKHKTYTREKPISEEIGGILGVLAAPGHLQRVLNLIHWRRLRRRCKRWRLSFALVALAGRSGSPTLSP